MAGVRFGIGEEAIGGPRPEAHGGAKMKPGKVGGIWGRTRGIPTTVWYD